MAQRIDYAVFPGVREDAYIATINKVFGHIRRSQLSLRDLREWLKDENLWNKEDAHHLLAFLDIHTDGQVRLGPWAESLFNAPDEEQGKELLFKRLIDQNTLLVKYMLEALDIEGGGRLHSTYEAHRMLTSYVYPGKHITLPNFQNWIKWIVASGRVKLIGIRWGLTDLGKQAVPRLRTVDPDEFLEDEAADERSGSAPAASPPPSPAAVAPKAAPSPAAAPAAFVGTAPSVGTAPAKPAAKPVPAGGEDLDEDLDLPPEPEPVDESVFSQYEAKYEESAPAPAAAPAPAPATRSGARSAPQAPAAAAVSSGAAQPAAVRDASVARTPVARYVESPALVAQTARVEVACSHQPMEVAEVLTALREYGRQNGLGGGSLLLAHGLESRLAQNEAARHLFLAGLVARAYGTYGDGALIDLLNERAGALGPVAILLDRPEALAEVVQRWGLAAADQASIRLRALLLDGVLGGRSLKSQADLPTVLAEAPTSETLLQTLQQTLLRGAPPLASFWLAREMVRAGLWTRPAATEIALVPSRPVRLMAYRLRLLDSHFAQGLPMLLAAARRLCALLPPGSVEAAAFEALAPNDHLRFDCTRLPICQQPCAWAPPA